MNTSAFETISVIGLGYVGLPTAAVIASRGVRVVGVDVSDRAITAINAGRCHFVEPELEGLVQLGAERGLLRAVREPQPADAFIIAVPTPIDHHSKAPDVSFVEAAGRSIAPVLKKGDTVVLESTCPVGTTERLARQLATARPDLRFPHTHPEACDVHMAYCPERILPGHVVKEIVENDRVVGGMTPACARRAAAMYAIFVKGECLLTEAKVAEMTKLAENSFRDVNIAYANELSLIADRVGVDVWKVIELANRHPRVNILQPGPGVGGHCIAVDPWFLVDSAPEEATLIRTAREVNDRKPEWVVGKVRAHADRFKNPRIACLGLAYKPDIDDVRESPAIEIVRHLAAAGVGSVMAVEPYVDALPRELEGTGVELHELGDALAGADIVALLVDHRPFRQIDRRRLADKIVVDTRGLWR